MKTGKISDSILRRSVLKKCTVRNPEVLQGAGIGNDCAVLDVQNKMTYSCSVHPETVEEKIMIRYAVEHALNNLACSGCVPAAVLITLLLPAGTQEEMLKAVMTEVETVCEKYSVQLAGGHTQVTEAVITPVITVTAVGGSDRRMAVKTGGYAGKDIVMTGYTGMEGCALLTEMRSEELCTKFPVDFVEQAKRYAGSISVAEEAALAWNFGAELLHDASQGGIFGALWELCERAGCGMEVNLRLLPIKQETVEICEYFGLNPYCLKSGGALLAVTEDGQAMALRLAKKGIPACVIGKLTTSNDRILINGEEKRYLERPAQDEYYRWKDMENGKA